MNDESRGKVAISRFPQSPENTHKCSLECCHNSRPNVAVSDQMFLSVNFVAILLFIFIL